MKLREWGFSPRVIDAFRNVNRKYFVSKGLVGRAYEDAPLPIGLGQTISQPYILAFMIFLLDIQNGQRVLEIGSGSGYVLAILAELNKDGLIWGFEGIGKFVLRSRALLTKYSNVGVFHDDAFSSLGDVKFDRIIVSAALDELPNKLISKNLDFGGKIVVPVRSSIFMVGKISGGNKIIEFPGFKFVSILHGKV